MTEPTDDLLIESLLIEYITKELATSPEMLPIRRDTRLFESYVLDSLSLLQLVLHIEKRFRIVVKPDEMVPQNFETIAAICKYLRTKLARTSE